MFFTKQNVSQDFSKTGHDRRTGSKMSLEFVATVNFLRDGFARR
jgi:hypothetical protein